MTKAVFYSGAASAEKFLGALLEKKLLPQGLRALVCAQDAAESERLSEALWTFSDASFVPHEVAENEEDFLSATPVLISSAAPPPSFAADVLVNFSLSLPPFYERFATLVEIAERREGPNKKARRENFRRLQEAGCDIAHHIIK